MKLTRGRIFFPGGIFIIASVAALMFFILPSSVSPYMNDQIPGFAEARDLNITNASLPNETIISQYPITPTPIKIGIMYEGTDAEAKGEMGAGPRTIGVSLSFGAFDVVLITIVVVVSCFGYLIWRKRKEKDDNEVK
jgi:hypothetical protein